MLEKSSQFFTVIRSAQWVEKLGCCLEYCRSWKMRSENLPLRSTRKPFNSSFERKGEIGPGRTKQIFVYFAKKAVIICLRQVRPVNFRSTKFCQSLPNFKDAVVLPRSSTNLCQAWNLTDLLIYTPWFEGRCKMQDARWLHFSRSGSQSQRAIWFILPARGASHIITWVIIYK